MRKHAFEQLRPHLQQGEVLLWCGRPVRGFPISGGIIVLGAVLLFVTWIWIIVIRAAIADGADRLPILILMSLVGCFVWSSVILGKLRYERSAYGVTDRRVIVADSLLGRSVKDIAYWRLSDVKLSGSRDFGTVRCARSSMSWKDQGKPGRVAYPALFRRIIDAGLVHDLIIEQCQRTLGPKSPVPALRWSQD